MVMCLHGRKAGTDRNEHSCDCGENSTQPEMKTIPTAYCIIACKQMVGLGVAPRVLWRHPLATSILTQVSKELVPLPSSEGLASPLIEEEWNDLLALHEFPVISFSALATDAHLQPDKLHFHARAVS